MLDSIIRNKIVFAITENPKRAKKLASLNMRLKREQAEKYIIAEARENKLQLSEDEIRKLAISITG